MNFNQQQQPNNLMGQYQKPYFNNTFTSAPAVSTSTNNIVWVQGIEGAKAWQLNPNSMVILLDSEAEGKMYIKVSDNIGMSNLRIFNYVEEMPQASSNNNVPINETDLSQFVTKDELTELVKELIKNEQSISTTSSTTAKSNVVSTVVKK